MAKIALLIGVGQFESDDLAPLPKSSADLDAMKDVLINPDLGGFTESNITVLKHPLKRKMEDKIYELFNKYKRKKDDLLLLYFSGHGIVDQKGRFYFSTYETRKDDGRLIPPTAISSLVVHQWMEECPCKRMAIILDCCHSGAFIKGMTAKGTREIKNEVEKQLEQLGGEGRAILTAASATDYAWSPDNLELSAYTHYLLEGISTGKANQDSDDWLSMEELHEYTSRKIKETGLDMTPEFYPVKGGAKIRLFKAIISDPQQRYRQEIQRYLKPGRIPSVARYRLEILRKKLQISEADARLIEAEVFAPVQKKKENLKIYEQAVKEVIAEEGSLDIDWIGNELERLQKELNLENIEVDAIEQKIIDAQEKVKLESELEDKLQPLEKQVQKAQDLEDSEQKRIVQSIINEVEAEYQESLKIPERGKNIEIGLKISNVEAQSGIEKMIQLTREREIDGVRQQETKTLELLQKFFVIRLKVLLFSFKLI